MAKIYDFKARSNKGEEVDFAQFEGNIVGFPCDQFGHQEPGTDAEIAEFCRLNHGVTFPLMSKIEVNGDNAHPIYKYLKRVAKGAFGSAIKWNFTKFLISRDGETVKRYAPAVTPGKMEKDIETLLG